MPLAHESIHDKYVLIDLLIYCVFTYLSMYLSMHLLLICFTFICLVAVSSITRVYFKTFYLCVCVFHMYIYAECKVAQTATKDAMAPNTLDHTVSLQFLF